MIVNSDLQARLKTGKQDVFQDETFRMKVVKAIRYVDEVFLSIDQDGSVCKSIEAIYHQIIAKY